MDRLRLVLLLLTSLVVTSIFSVSGFSPLRKKGLPSRARRGRVLDETNGRLPQTLIPYHYNLDIAPDITAPQPPFPFYGHVDIYFECVTETDVITLSNYELSITDGTIVVSVSPDSPGDPPDPVFVDWEENEDVEFVYFYLEDLLIEGEKYVISMDFTGTLRDDGYGFYYDSYIAETGFIRYLASTQLEEIGGRMMFPGFDEPDFKATFNTTVQRFPTDVSISNMPLLRTEARPGGWMADIYEQSPVMSLYLVCVCVGDFTLLEAENLNGYDVGIWSRPQMLDQMAFSVEHAPHIQAWLDEETGVTYSLPKSDHIALPNKGGAMENWGLITYGETVFAVDPETSAASGIQNVGLFMAHELAHMWYGDLVTCKWWDDIWLNEGFATYYDYRPTEVLGWEGSEASQWDTQWFMEDDQKNTSDPVRKVVDTPWDADAAFGGSTYPKGGAMVYMLEGILTTPTFKSAMTTYLQKYQYQTATTDDLWEVLTEQAAEDGRTYPDGSPYDLKSTMDPWLNQMGLPLVTVTRNDIAITATVSRSLFLRPPNQIMETTSPWNYAWDTPITVVTADSAASEWDAGPVAWINIDEEAATIGGLPEDPTAWVIVNPKQKMYYRVLYDDVSRANIVNQLLDDHSVIDVQSRSQLIDDTFNIARANYIPETEAMETTLYLASETKFVPWYAALLHLEYSDRLISQQTWAALQRTYVLSLSVPVYDSLGWDYSDSETPFEQFLRRDIISVTCLYGEESCLAEARTQYALILPDPSDNTVVDPNNLPTVLCVGISEGDESDYTMSFDQYLERQESQIREERYAYLFGCSCTMNEGLLDQFLAELGNSIAPRDRNRAAVYISQSEYGAGILWDFLDANWDSVPSGLGRYTALGNIAAGFSTTEDLDRLLTFTENHPPGSTQVFVDLYTQMVLTVEANIDWLDNQGPLLNDWLADHQPLSGGRINVEATKTGRPYRMPSSPLKHWATVDAAYKEEFGFRRAPY